MARRSGGQRGSGRQKKPATKRHFPRTARLNSLLTEIVADYLERVDDERFGFMTVTGVEVDSDLNVAQVFVSTLGDTDDDELLDALEEYRRGVQSAIASQAKLRKTPHATFAFDPGVRHGARVDEILATLDISHDDEDEDESADPTDSTGTVAPDEAPGDADPTV